VRGGQDATQEGKNNPTAHHRCKTVGTRYAKARRSCPAYVCHATAGKHILWCRILHGAICLTACAAPMFGSVHVCSAQTLLLLLRKERKKATP
jgi:hypothetical protein